MESAPPTEAGVRAEARDWLEANWSPDLGLVEWRNRLIDSGWGVPAWPKAWFGRELPAALEPVVAEEMRRAGAVGVASVNSGSVPVPKTACITVPAEPATMQCAQGYSGCMGVGPRGSQVASRSVAALPSSSPLRMAVTGRQNS